ncbi:helix-turn-helix domain-containing protein [Arcticibacterium luteifluviistationis]|uniref:AraC family transcriptional regulator n=1 Tax=Arcticibacterium luteifluviistationis TaxID=1784714 RepID=A0A2Z4GFV0_9BACT|nr:response regulator transcription factor [Arcticibacterium luteifluviistationis]AWW00273.1 AraC family transcriptional regulator [Arcticibacterium luteifluviistationis]
MQNKLRKIETISDFHKIRGLGSPLHPLVSLIDYGLAKLLPEYIGETWHFNFYSIGLKRDVGVLRYGQQKYDFSEGILSFIAPGQLLSIEPNTNATLKPSGWLLLVHPDFIWNSSLAKSIKAYDFFNYAINEALFMSKKEEKLIESILQNIGQEIEGNIDHFSQNIIIAQIELLLSYSERFYQRQFITRKKSNHEVLERLETLLNDFFNDENSRLPTVQYVAEQLNLSPNYLSNLLKSLTGQNTQQHIHEKLIEKAKEQLATTNLSVSEIAYQLGFEHSQSFSKLFKSKTNYAPLKFRQTFN